jgi:Cof subfamily protein (haloacid dehalogenase superfamily)
MYKLLALDLDGTVLNSQHRIHPEVKAAINELKQDYHVMIVTGRHHTAAKPYHAELGLTTPIICCNGSYVYDYHQRQVLRQNALSREVALRFLSLAQDSQMKILMYVDDAMLYSKSVPVDFITDILQWAQQYSGDLKPNVLQVESFAAHARDADYIWKFVVEGNAETIKEFRSHPWILDNFNGEQSWHDRFDFSAQGNSKGARLAEFVADLGLKPNEVVAIGDNHNDISMLQYAGLGVAMGNASSEVQQHADCVCDGDHNGPELGTFIRRVFSR